MLTRRNITQRGLARRAELVVQQPACDVHHHDRAPVGSGAPWQVVHAQRLIVSPAVEAAPTRRGFAIRSLCSLIGIERLEGALGTRNKLGSSIEMGGHGSAKNVCSEKQSTKVVGVCAQWGGLSLLGAGISAHITAVHIL